MPVLDASTPFVDRQHRILIGGTSGSGKSTLARHLALLWGIPYVEIDALHHGSDWVPRSEFMHDVRELASQQSWITEYQYAEARPVLLARCDLMIYLALPRSVVMRRIILRTVRRSIRREVLWNGNVEPPLRTIFTDRDHIIRWAWRTHGGIDARLDEIADHRPDLPIVVLRTAGQVRDWIADRPTSSGP